MRTAALASRAAGQACAMRAAALHGLQRWQRVRSACGDGARDLRVAAVKGDAMAMAHARMEASARDLENSYRNDDVHPNAIRSSFFAHQPTTDSS